MGRPVSVNERFTVGFIPDAWLALLRLCRRSGLKKTDVINRAVQVYDPIDYELRRGRHLIIRDPRTGEEERFFVVGSPPSEAESGG